MARLGSTLLIAQDDVLALAQLEEGGVLSPIALPRGHDGRRRFDDAEGNKRYKLDLEALAVLPEQSGSTLVAFGSGSTPLRESVVVLRNLERQPSVQVIAVPLLYQALRALPEVTSELNIEGACEHDGVMTLVHRSNGIAHAVDPCCLLCDVATDDIRALITAKNIQVRVVNVQCIRLGAIGGVQLTLTDIDHYRGQLFFCAAAEQSPDAVHDGPIAGSAIGRVDLGYANLENERGVPSADKIEGIVISNEERCLAVVDSDQPDQPAELLTIELTGFGNR